MSWYMPVGNQLHYGGRHNTIFRDSLTQRVLIVRGTAAIRRIEAEQIIVDQLTVNNSSLVQRSDVVSDTSVVPSALQIYNAPAVRTLIDTKQAAIEIGDEFTTTSASSKAAQLVNTALFYFQPSTNQIRMQWKLVSHLTFNPSFTYYDSLVSTLGT